MLREALRVIIVHIGVEFIFKDYIIISYNRLFEGYVYIFFLGKKGESGTGCAAGSGNMT